MIQFDFVGNKGLKRPALLDESGAHVIYEVALGVSAQSRKLFIKAIESQALRPVTEFFVDMFEFFGGVPVLVTLDNFKAAVKEPRRGSREAILTPGFQALADHYGFGVEAARIRKPRDKAIAENSVGICQSDILAPLRNRSFFSLRDLNTALIEKMNDVNARPMKGHRDESRYERHCRLDGPSYVSLPERSYDYGDWYIAMRVGQDYHISVESNRYSVSVRLIGEKVNVKVTSHSVHIYHSGISVWSHKRECRADQIVTEPRHMPENHRSAALTRLAGMKALVREIGPYAVALIDNHFRTGKKIRVSAEATIKLLALAEQYDVNRVDAAYSKALRVGKPFPAKVEELLRSGLETYAPDAASMGQALSSSDNVRGAEYFAKLLHAGTRSIHSE